jgi:hypothetical protein
MRSSNPIDLMFKLLMGRTANGITPFWSTNPTPGCEFVVMCVFARSLMLFSADFGWLKDPLLEEISALLNMVYNQTGQAIPWTSAVPGSIPNYTDVDDTRLRRQKDTYKTGLRFQAQTILISVILIINRCCIGKKNIKQVGKFVSYQQMTSTYACAAPADTIPQYEGFIEGEKFPACALFDPSWTPEEAEAKGALLRRM